MKEELQSKLVEILTSMQTAAGKAGDFAMAQLPDIAQSYVAFGRVWAPLCMVFSLVVLGASAYFVLAARAAVARDVALKEALPAYDSFFGKYSRSQEDGFKFYVPAVVFGVLGFAMFAVNAYSAALVWLAPKVWLLKEIAGLMK